LRGRLNTHQRHIAVALQNIGLFLSKEGSLLDDQDEISRAVKSALKRCDVLLVCGGLGPTFDDLTREGVSNALGRDLVYHKEIFDKIKTAFRRHRMEIPEENKRQAFVISGATVLSNPFGSAPGQLIPLPRQGRQAQLIALMPGPFAEMAPMLKNAVLPLLRRIYSQIHAQNRSFHLCGIFESEADERLLPLIKSAPKNLNFTILASSGQVDFYITATGRSSAESRRLLSSASRKVRQAVGKYIFSEGEKPLEDAIGRKLVEKKMTLAVAESCTAGLVCARITNISGSSRYFFGGAVSYANELKTNFAGVDPVIIERHGAVSPECARAMAEGIRKRTGASLGISITGIAGPTGGTPQKPVGLIYIGLSQKKRRTICLKRLLSGNRQTIRERAASSALTLLWSHLRR
jgi:nicotinamide-nucleotide amidase